MNKSCRINTLVSTHRKIQKNLSKKNLIKRIGTYGFVECATMLSFLTFACDETLDSASWQFLHSKIKACLDKYDRNIYGLERSTDDAYFMELRRLREELEYITSIAKS